MGKGRRVNDEARQRLVTLLAAGLAFGMSHAVIDRFLENPDEQRGIKEDALEAVLKGAVTTVSTFLASVAVRRWGTVGPGEDR